MINVDDRLILNDMRKLKQGFNVLLAIVIHMNKDNKAFPSIYRLSQITGIGERTISREIKKLCDNGYLARNQENKNGVFGKITYEIKVDGIGFFVDAKGKKMIESPSAKNDTTVGKKEPSAKNRTAANRHAVFGDLSIKEVLSINKDLSIKAIYRELKKIRKEMSTEEFICDQCSLEEGKLDEDGEFLCDKCQEEKRKKIAAKKEKKLLEIKIVNLKKELNAAKSENKLLVKKVNIDDSLSSIDKIKKAKRIWENFFKDYPDNYNSIISGAMYDESKYNLASDELFKFLEKNLDDYQVLSKPNRYCARFQTWLMKAKSFNQPKRKINKNGKGKGNSRNSDYEESKQHYGTGRHIGIDG